MRRNFEDISIMGRVAYGIGCLENAILHYHYNKKEWEFVLEKLWSYTNIEYLDDWYYQVAELMPDAILEDDKYDEAEYEFIDANQFYILYNLYINTCESVKQIIRLIFDMGSKELYGKIQGHSDDTLSYLQEIINCCKNEDINLPNLDQYKQYHFDKNSGWGESFDGSKISLLVK